MTDTNWTLESIAASDTLPQLTMQQMFDLVTEHLAKQGKQAQDVNGYCKYRASGGAKCAAGALIPDSLVPHKHMGIGVRGLYRFGVVRKYFDTTAAVDLGLALLESLQCVHDAAPPDGTAVARVWRSWTYWEDNNPRPLVEYNGWAEGLRIVARGYGLDDSAVDRWFPSEEEADA